jgi:hypothetical protein
VVGDGEQVVVDPFDPPQTFGEGISVVVEIHPISHSVFNFMPAMIQHVLEAIHYLDFFHDVSALEFVQCDVDDVIVDVHLRIFIEEVSALNQEQ